MTFQNNLSLSLAKLKMQIFSLTLTSYLAALVVTIILSFISVGIYRAFFSPLAQIPGPRLWAATRIPMF